MVLQSDGFQLLMQVLKVETTQSWRC